MFPKGPQKKKDTIVVIVDGKTPQTIPTMDTPPEPRKLPRCRLLLVLTVLLILCLCLLAGYCAWLFFSYEANSTDSVVVIDEEEHQRPTGDRHQQPKRPVKGPILVEEGVSSSIGPSLSDIEKGSFTVNSMDGVSNSDSDFNFLSSSGSSESVYDSSEPYGDSDFSSSMSWGNEEPYSSDYLSVSVDGTTRKSDSYLVPGSKKGRGWFIPALENFLQTFPGGFADVFSSDDSSYDVQSSSSDDSEGIRESDGEGFYGLYSDVMWDTFSEIEDGSGVDDDDDVTFEDWSSEFDYSSMASDWPIDLFSDVFSDDDAVSYEGSGEPNGWYLSYDSYDDNDGYIPRPVEPPAAQIDQLPPERIEIAVCNWPKKLFEKEAHRYGSVKMAQYPNPNYDVTSMSTSNVDITQIRSEVNGMLTSRIFMRDYSVAIVAVREMIKTPTYSISKCYFSFLTPDLREDTFGLGNDDEDEFEGSGIEDELQELTLEIRSPILLGSDLPIFSNPISKICLHSTKYWATSINVAQ